MFEKSREKKIVRMKFVQIKGKNIVQTVQDV